jgi:hypothetical protein
VVLPLLKPALVAALVYSFVRAMTTVSAVIFLVTAENELATTYIIGRVGNGDYGVALAYCTVLIVLMSLATALIQFLVGERKLGRRKTGAPPPQGGRRAGWPVPASREERPSHHGTTMHHGIEFGTSPSATALTAVGAAGRQGCQFEVPQRHAHHHPRPLGLRQDHGAAHDCGAGVAHLGPDPHGRQGRDHAGAGERNVSMMFQSYALFPHMNVVENVMYGLRCRVAKDEARARGSGGAGTWAWSATTTACPASSPAASSSAWRWRARWCWSRRCCCSTSRCPTSTRACAARCARKSAPAAAPALTVAYVTHDQSEALAVSDQIIVMNDGLIAQRGSPRDMYERPHSEFVAGFMGEAMLFPAWLGLTAPPTW